MWLFLTASSNQLILGLAILSIMIQLSSFAQISTTGSRRVATASTESIKNTCKAQLCSNISTSSTTIIPKQKKIIFIHVPKTGGETLEALFRIEKNHYHAYYRCLGANQQIGQAYKIGCQHPANELYLSIVRNPFDRMFSWFHFCIHGWFDLKKGYLHIPGPLPFSGCDVIRKKVYYDNHTFSHINTNDSKLIELDVLYTQNIFEYYLNHTYALAVKALHPPNFKPKNDMQYAVWATYDFYFTDPVNHTMLVDHVMRFEDIYPKGEMAGTCMALHRSLCSGGIAVDLPYKLPHENSNHEAKYSSAIIFTELLQFLRKLPTKRYYSERSRQLVEHYYAVDLKQYNYAF